MTEGRVFKVFRGAAGLAQLEGDWRRLTERVARPRVFHLYEWHRSYVGTLVADDADLFFFAAYRGGGEIEAILPLRRVTRRKLGLGFTVFEFPSHPDLPIRDVLIDRNAEPGSLMADFAAFLRSSAEHRCDIFRVERALEESAVATMVRAERTVLGACEAMGRCNYLPVAAGRVSGAVQSKNLKAALRKARSRAAKLGAWTCLSTRDPAELPGFFQKFLEIESSGWKGAHGTAIVNDPALRAFYESLVRNFSPHGACEINLLALEGKVIAGQFVLVADGTAYLQKIGYDEQSAALSPGNLLLDEMLTRYGQDASVRDVNLVADTAWHQAWRPEHYTLLCCERFNATVPGLLAYGLKRVKRGLRRLQPGRAADATGAQGTAGTEADT